VKGVRDNWYKTVNDREGPAPACGRFDGAESDDIEQSYLMDGTSHPSRSDQHRGILYIWYLIGRSCHSGPSCSLDTKDPSSHILSIDQVTSKGDSYCEVS
jgi:hypothetical protein